MGEFLSNLDLFEIVSSLIHNAYLAKALIARYEFKSLLMY